MEGCPSYRHSLPPSLILQFMLIIYYSHNFWVFLGSCDRPMPGSFLALPIFLEKKPWERGCTLI